MSAMFFRIFPAFLLLFMSSLGWGQIAPDTAAQPVDSGIASVPDKAKASEAAPGKDWRNTSGYPFPSLADTVAAAQNMAQAMLLRDYCANRRLPDDFVRDRLARFSRITGREEDCQSLLGY